jgi:hypothetical protein
LKKGDRGGFEFEFSRCHYFEFLNELLRRHTSAPPLQSGRRSRQISLAAIPFMARANDPHGFFPALATRHKALALVLITCRRSWNYSAGFIRIAPKH